MKKLFFLLILGFAGLLVSTTSCKKAIEKLTPTFSCDVNAVNWSTHSVIGSKSDTGIVYTAYEDSIMVMLTLKELKLGSFVIDNKNNFATYTHDNSMNIYLGTSGSINVTKVSDSQVDLNFEFKGFNAVGDSVIISHGVGNNLLYLKQ